MPGKKVLDRRRTPPPSSNARVGDVVRRETEAARRGKHGARSSPRAVVIGLAKARREGLSGAGDDSTPRIEKRKPSRKGLSVANQFVRSGGAPPVARRAAGASAVESARLMGQSRRRGKAA